MGELISLAPLCKHRFWQYSATVKVLQCAAEPEGKQTAKTWDMRPSIPEKTKIHMLLTCDPPAAHAAAGQLSRTRPQRESSGKKKSLWG